MLLALVEPHIHAVGLNTNAFFRFSFCRGGAMWQPWSIRPGCVEANVVYLQGGQRLPPLPVAGHFEVPATATLGDVQTDIATLGCRRCTIKALAVFARPLRYGADGPGPSASHDDPIEPGDDEPHDTDSNLTDVIVTEDPVLSQPDAADAPEDASSDVVIPDLTHEQQARLDHRVHSMILQLIQVFDENDAADPYQSAMTALHDTLAGVDRTSVGLFRANQAMQRSLPCDAEWD